MNFFIKDKYNTRSPRMIVKHGRWLEKKKLNTQTAKMNFLTRVISYRLKDRKRNDDIKIELDMFSINDKVKGKQKWMEHVYINGNEQSVKQSYKPAGRGSAGRTYETKAAVRRQNRL